jgi:hypothetical protein
VELRRYPPIARLRAEMADAGFTSVREEVVERTRVLTDAAGYRDKVYSSLLYIDEEAFQRGLARLEADLRDGPIHCKSRYLLLWGSKPWRQDGSSSPHGQ